MMTMNVCSGSVAFNYQHQYTAYRRPFPAPKKKLGRGRAQMNAKNAKKGRKFSVLNKKSWWWQDLTDTKTAVMLRR
jgi:hypothetical protein